MRNKKKGHVMDHHHPVEIPIDYRSISGFVQFYAGAVRHWG
jgi:hypothetical protein